MKNQELMAKLTSDANNQKMVLTFPDKNSRDVAYGHLDSYITLPDENMANAITYFGVEEISENDTTIVFTNNLKGAINLLKHKEIISESMQCDLLKKLNLDKWNEKEEPKAIFFQKKKIFNEIESPEDEFQNALNKFMKSQEDRLKKIPEEKVKEMLQGSLNQLKNIFHN